MNLEWFRKAAEQEHAASQYQLAHSYRHGLGVERNEAEAGKWYRRSAEQGHALAQLRMGLTCENGPSPAENDTEAGKWYQEAARELPQAGFYLAIMYEDGRGVGQDCAKAARLYRKAAEDGLAEAQCRLGRMYARGLGVKRDFSEAAKWYRKAAWQGYAPGEFYTGLMYERGLGLPKFDARAVNWYTRAGLQGWPEAILRLAAMHDKGCGVPQDRAEAARLYLICAEQGMADAQFRLGVLHDEGLGVPEDDAQAAKWYRKAAEQGHVGGQAYLGSMYENGEGVDRDLTEAVKWYSMAGKQGGPDCREVLGARCREGWVKTMTGKDAAGGRPRRFAYDWMGGLTGTVVSAASITNSAPDDSETPHAGNGRRSPLPRLALEYHPGTRWVASRVRYDGQKCLYDYYPNGLLAWETDGFTTKYYEYENGRTTRTVVRQGEWQLVTTLKYHPQTGLHTETHRYQEKVPKFRYLLLNETPTAISKDGHSTEYPFEGGGLGLTH